MISSDAWIQVSFHHRHPDAFPPNALPPSALLPPNALPLNALPPPNVLTLSALSPNATPSYAFALLLGVFELLHLRRTKNVHKINQFQIEDRWAIVMKGNASI